MSNENILSDEELIGVSGGNQGNAETKYCWNCKYCPKGYWRVGAGNEEKQAAVEQNHCEVDPAMNKVYCREYEANAVPLIGRGKGQQKKLTQL